MKIPRASAIAGVLVLAFGMMGAAPAAPASAPAPVAGAKNEFGLTATLISGKESYGLDPVQSGKEFRARLDVMKNVGKLPAPPAVDFVLRLTNTTDKEMLVTIGGDESMINVKLEGPGAVTLTPNVAMTMEFRSGSPIKIAAGQSMDYKITSLQNGMRGMSEFNYWTEAGNYKVTATLTYGAGEKQAKVTSGATAVVVK